AMRQSMNMMARINKAYPHAAHSINGIQTPSAISGAVMRRRSKARVVGSIIFQMSLRGAFLATKQSPVFRRLLRRASPSSQRHVVNEELPLNPKLSESPNPDRVL